MPSKPHRTVAECLAIRDKVRRIVANNSDGREDLKLLIDMLGLYRQQDADAVYDMQRAKPTPLPLASDPSFCFHQ